MDEEVSNAIDYLNSKPVHDAICDAFNAKDLSAILDIVQNAHIAGYSAASSSRWLEYPKHKPTRGGKYAAIFHGNPGYWYELYYNERLKYWLDGQGGHDLNVTHFMEITLPTKIEGGE